MRVGSPRAVADLLVSAVPELRERLLEQGLRRAWPRLVGADVARRTRPRALVNGCLEVVVDNSPWLHELTLRSAELTARISAEWSSVRSLRFVPGTLPPDEPLTLSREPRPRPLTAAELREIEEATSVISDSMLAAAARRLLAKAWRFPRA